MILKTTLKFDLDNKVELGTELQQVALSSDKDLAFLYDENTENEYQIYDVVFSGGYFVFKCEGNQIFSINASQVDSFSLYYVLTAINKYDK